MKIEQLHIGMKVKHPQHGLGVVRALTEHTADILFTEGARTVAPETSELEPVEARAAVSGLEVPLGQFVESVVGSVIAELGLEKDDTIVAQLASRWHGGRMVLHPADVTLQPKDVLLEVFFHKIVMLRNNLRVLEQKINSHEKLTDADKVELQQYVSRCYGSLTTFNVLFKNKADQFHSGAAGD
jgi:hypothetical protein